MIFFESCNSMKMKTTFISASYSRKWKWLSAVMLTLSSQQTPARPFVTISKVVIQWKWKRLSTSFWLVFKAKVSRFTFSDLFRNSQFNQHEKDFQRHLGLFSKQKQAAPLLVTYFESPNSMEWKGLSAVIFTLSSQQTPAQPFVIVLESRNSMKMKKTFNVILACFHSESKPQHF